MRRIHSIIVVLLLIGLSSGCDSPATHPVHKRELSNKTFEHIKRNTELQNAGIIYDAVVELPAHGRIEVCFSVDRIEQLEPLISTAEQSIQKFKTHERELLVAAIPLVEAFYGKYYERKISLNRDVFVKGLHLELINFGPDGSMSLWYGTLRLEMFYGKDIKISLNSSFKVSEVRFDG